MGILRVIYALGVYFFHTGWINGFVIFSDPYKPVYSFFIISGFYMAFILNKKYVGKSGSYRLFITNRFLRIYPIYWVVILLSLLFSGVLLWFRVDTGGISGFLRYYTFLLHGHALWLPVAVADDVIRNMTIVFHCGYFARCVNDAALNGIGVIWTLNLEILFYLIAPFLLRRKGVARLGVIAGVFLLWFIIFHFRLLPFYSNAYAFMHAMKLFMLGFIGFMVYEKLPLRKIPPITLVGICLVFFVFILMYSHIPLPSLRYRWLIFNDYIYYLSVTAALPFMFQFSNLFRFDTFIGQLSYPIYISHLLTNTMLETTHLVKPHTLPFTIIGLMCALIFSFAVMYLLENPIDRYRQKRIAVAQVPAKISKTRQIRKRPGNLVASLQGA
jgi:peptidoglycan/LPS O-acetylase OafA/YrhL